MPSNLDFDPVLLSEVQKLGNFKFKKEAINAALKEFILRRRQKEICELFGSIDYDGTYDYKIQRKRL